MSYDFTESLTIAVSPITDANGRRSTLMSKTFKCLLLEIASAAGTLFDRVGLLCVDTEVLTNYQRFHHKT